MRMEWNRFRISVLPTPAGHQLRTDAMTHCDLHANESEKYGHRLDPEKTENFKYQVSQSGRLGGFK